MILLDWHFTLTYTKSFSSCLCFEIYGKFRNVNGDLAFVFSVLLSLFLCNFICSPSFFLFHLQGFFVYKGPISVLKKGVFLRKKGRGKNFFLHAQGP